MACRPKAATGGTTGVDAAASRGYRARLTQEEPMPEATPIHETIHFLRERFTRAPHAILVLGSGLGGLADEIEDAVAIPFYQSPGFPRRTDRVVLNNEVAGIVRVEHAGEDAVAVFVIDRVVRDAGALVRI